MGFLVLSAFLVLAPAPGLDDPPPARPAPPIELVIEVKAGRATIVRGEEISVWTRSQGPLRIQGDAYLELGPASELLLRRPGLSSFRVRGPAAVEWTRPAPPDEEKREGAARPAPPELRFLRLRTLEVEVRRGRQIVRLPEAWGLDVPRGALHVASGPSGLRLEHRGGLAVRVIAEAPRDAEEAPAPLQSGGRMALPLWKDVSGR